MDPRFLFTLPGIPRRGISRAMGWLARRPIPLLWRRRLWGWLAKRLQINPATISTELRDYPSFLDLFTRPLPEGSRQLPEHSGWLSPADGRLVTSDKVSAEGSWVIKGTPYTTRELLPGGHLDGLLGYQALQIYLSPRDYHRFHAPCDMEVLEALVEPGDLQPVDPNLVRRSMRVLKTNRRILLHCRSERGAPFSMLFVGALNVGGMRFVFDSTLGRAPWIRSQRRYDPPPILKRGEELGRFEFGSTIVLFVPPELRCTVELGGDTRARCGLLQAKGGVEGGTL